MRNAIFLLVSLATLVQFGCLGSGPRREDFDKADFGSYPSNHMQLIQDRLSQVLIDPGSVQNLRSSEPKPMWIQPMFVDPVVYGYGCWFSYNAKNRYGGYVGQKTYFAFFRNGQLLRTIEDRYMVGAGERP